MCKTSHAESLSSSATGATIRFNYKIVVANFINMLEWKLIYETCRQCGEGGEHVCDWVRVSTKQLLGVHHSARYPPPTSMAQGIYRHTSLLALSFPRYLHLSKTPPLHHCSNRIEWRVTPSLVEIFPAAKVINLTFYNFS